MSLPIQSLPFPLRPTSDERLTHYLARVTKHHNYDSVAWLLDAVGLRDHQQTKTTGLRRALHEPDAAAPLAELCGVETSSIERMQLQRLGLSRDVERVSLGDFAVRRDLLVPLRRRYCPTCETDGLEDSKLVDFAYYLACPRHRCQIVDACSCGESFSWDSGLFNCCAACDEPHSIKSGPATEELVHLSTHLASVYSGQAAPDDVPYRDFETLAMVLKALAGIIIPKSSLGRYEYSAEKLDYETLALHASTAWRWIRSRASFESEFFAWVDQRREAWPALPTRGWHVDLQRVVSDISDIESKNKLSLWIEGARCEHQRDVGSMPARSLPKRNDVTLRWAAWILGTTEHNIKRFVKAGRLKTKLAFESSKRSDLLISLAQLNEFCSSLRSVSNSDLQGAGTPFLSAARSFRKNGAGLGVDSALGDVLMSARAAAWKSGSGLEGLMLGPEKAEAPSPCDDELASALSIADAAREIGIYQDALYRLIKAGLLKPRERSKLNQLRYCLTVEQLNKFKNAYVFAGELARQWGVGRTSLTDRLIDQGILPVSGPNIDGGLIYLFRRDSLKGFKAESVQKHVSYKSRAGRHVKNIEKPESVTSKQICERLRLSTQMLSKVVNAGYLTPASESYACGNRRVFLPTEVEDYARNYFENAELIEITEAAKRIGCSRQSFFRRYVMTGLVTPFSDGTQRLFFNRHSLTEALSEDAEWLPCFRAAEVLKVDRTKLANLRKTGRIKCQVRTVKGRRIHYFPIRECIDLLSATD